jgi:hypothetical protein
MEKLMAISTMILGDSGTGKTTSLRNLDPIETLIIRPIKKPLPFKSKDWKEWDGDTKVGSIVSTENYEVLKAILKSAHKYGKKIIVIDDFNYYMSGEFMRRASEKGYDKYSEIGFNYWSVIDTANQHTPDDVRVYFLSHTEENASGKEQIKTIGRMVSEKIVPEGMVTTVLGSIRTQDGYYFNTQNNGRNTLKSPMGMFEEEMIQNDLKVVDQAICDFYEI